MYSIRMDVLCLEGYSEVLPGNAENTALVIEDLVARILLDIFGMVVVDGVQITLFPASATQQAYYILQVQATCSSEEVNMSASTASLALLEATLENAICCALIELFSAVLVNKLIVCYEPRGSAETAVLAYSV